MDQLMCASIFPHPLLVLCGHVESIGYIYQRTIIEQKAADPMKKRKMRKQNKTKQRKAKKKTSQKRKGILQRQSKNVEDICSRHLWLTNY